MTSPRSDRPQCAPAEGAASSRRPLAKMPPLGGVGDSFIRGQPGPPIWGPYPGLSISNSRKMPETAPEARRRGRQALVSPRASSWHHGGSARTHLYGLWQLPAREPATFPGRAPGPPTRPRRYGPAPLTSAHLRGGGASCIVTASPGPALPAHPEPCPCSPRALRCTSEPRQLGLKQARASGGRLGAAELSAAVLAWLGRSCGHPAARGLGTVGARARSAVPTQLGICAFLGLRRTHNQINPTRENEDHDDRPAP